MVGGEEGGRRRSAIDGVYTELRREVAGLAVCVRIVCTWASAMDALFHRVRDVRPACHFLLP